MPRGNDSAEAAAELANRYGEGAGNAESLIEANAARFSQELVAAQLLGVNDSASAELDYDAVAKAADLPEGSKLLRAVVRHGEGDPDGGYVTFVAQTGDRVWKGALERDGDDLSNPGAEVRSSADVHRASIHADVQARRKAAEAIAEAEADAAKHREEALAEAQRVIDEANEEAARIKEQAAKDAAKSDSEESASADADDSSSAPVAPTRGKGSSGGSNPRGKGSSGQTGS